MGDITLSTTEAEAFDTVSHDLLFKRLHKFGVSSDALKWIKSYLCGRTQSVCVSGYKSNPILLKYGVPQGSILGPVFFTDCSSPVASIIRSHAIYIHCYADDTQLYIPFKKSTSIINRESVAKMDDYGEWLQEGCT